MGDGDDQNLGLDLFGQPMRPIRDPRGRPCYAKTKENQLLVMTLRGSGWTQTDIATYMRCDPQTLRKHFSRELDHGATLLQGLAMQALVGKMLAGHVGAAKEIMAITRATAAPSGKGKGKGEAADPIGKKAKAHRDAQQPPDGWGDLLKH